MRSGPIGVQAITADDGTGRYWYDGNIDKLNEKNKVIDDILKRRAEKIEQTIDTINKRAQYVAGKALTAAEGASVGGLVGAVAYVGIDIATDVIKHYTPDQYDGWIDLGIRAAKGTYDVKNIKNLFKLFRRH
ncbi:hypothetical protein XO10_05495 [Marinitoga sp. 1135]|uniref:hypothetical protein n=1 Tax=unclassified Marinitoga TaxID=2640159 RepID=UPI001586A19A|nr:MULTISPECIES: hypothetical protein [unclassified Marinitoga]NUU95728.1 hypothetical protein [Marinitoga sp. 1135]NUU97660.1 hypothetical protein [Marinitoga sp. 1138]